MHIDLKTFEVAARGDLEETKLLVAEGGYINMAMLGASREESPSRECRQVQRWALENGADPLWMLPPSVFAGARESERPNVERAV